MKFFILNTLILSFIVTITSTELSLKKDAPTKKIIAGTLTEESYNTVLSALNKIDNKTIKDTIIINYNYEKESCWNMLDKQKDSYVKEVIKNGNSRIFEQEAKRKNISVFQLTDGKSRTNKIIKWNDEILIDTDKNIHNLLLEKKAMCGNSILITPSRKYVVLKSDAHFELLDYTKKDLIKIFNAQL